ncbi:N-acetyltransferase family protein [Allosphingosinicella sp.]|uniref:GNAT family N-acetyltransferase n=1 Tax=Allosphingosinicella sp. TaxID=2823234 RepID=UPI002FC268EA
MLRPATPEDAAAIADIYAPYVTASAISFETNPPDASAMRSRIEACGDLYPWLVATDESRAVLGYASASAYRPRPAYRFTVETSVYVDRQARRQGIGRTLYFALLETLEAQGFTQSIAAITLPNESSVRLHEAIGFEQAGVYRDVGYKLGQWLSVGLWQRPLAPMREPPEEPKPFASVWDR